MNPSTLEPGRLTRLRKVCLALPDATEKRAWGDPTWRVGDRIFAMQKGNYAGGRPSVWLKAAPGDQAVLVDLDPQRFFVPPYLGHRGWIGVYLDSTRMDWPMLSRLIAQSHGLVVGGGRRADRVAPPRGTPRQRKQP
ncbi:MAG TPA: MmcQ/YjbR family DNA-binding protein [Myxococcaceae bacterium]|nr:MmcQ/YjbR family DNA-binding protein [Myxococcaceae bacterium]